MPPQFANYLLVATTPISQPSSQSTTSYRRVHTIHNSFTLRLSHDAAAQAFLLTKFEDNRNSKTMSSDTPQTETISCAARYEENLQNPISENVLPIGQVPSAVHSSVKNRLSWTSDRGSHASPPTSEGNETTGFLSLCGWNFDRESLWIILMVIVSMVERYRREVLLEIWIRRWRDIFSGWVCA